MTNPAGIRALHLDHLDEDERDDLLMELFISALNSSEQRIRLRVPRLPSADAYYLRKIKRSGRRANGWHRVRGHMYGLTRRALDDLYAESGRILGVADIMRALELYAEVRLRHFLYLQEPGDPAPSSYQRWAYVTHESQDKAIESASLLAWERWAPPDERARRSRANLLLGQQSKRRPTKNTSAMLYRLQALRDQEPGLSREQEAKHLGVSLRTLYRLGGRLHEIEL